MPTNATNVLGHMMYGYTWLLPVNQRVLNKIRKVRNLRGHIVFMVPYAYTYTHTHTHTHTHIYMSQKTDSVTDNLTMASR